MGYQVGVDEQLIWNRDDDILCDTPDAAAQFIELFDSGKRFVSPFTFEIPDP